jgi:hypothetical protein
MAGPGDYCFATQAADRAGNVQAMPTGAGTSCTSYGPAGSGFFIYLPVIVK